MQQLLLLLLLSLVLFAVIAVVSKADDGVDLIVHSENQTDEIRVHHPAGQGNKFCSDDPSLWERFLAVPQNRTKVKLCPNSENEKLGCKMFLFRPPKELLSPELKEEVLDFQTETDPEWNCPWTLVKWEFVAGQGSERVKFIRKNGRLRYVEGKGWRKLEFESSEYCITDSGEKENRSISFLICPPFPLPKTCCLPQNVQKCCPQDQLIDEQQKWKCKPFPPEEELSSSWPSGSKTGLPDCRSYVIRHYNGTITPNPNGDVNLAGTLLKAGEYCMDKIQQNGTGSHISDGVIICDPNPLPVKLEWVPYLYAAFNFPSGLFLFLTALVYMILWSRHNIHGWLQFSYAFSLGIAFTLLGVIQAFSQQVWDYSENVCKHLGWIVHFFILSSFFWLTAMNFDLWWRFSGRRYMMRIRNKPLWENVGKFLVIAAFCVGVPMSITWTAVHLDHKFQEAPHELWINLSLPEFGKKKCYFKDKKSQFPFLYLPVGILLLINLIFFSSTVCQLRKIHVNTEFATSQSTIHDKTGVRLISKLFFVMGILWIFEFVSWAAMIVYPSKEDLLLWIFMPTECLNSLQGVAIFFIFIWKPNVINQLKIKLGIRPA